MSSRSTRSRWASPASELLASAFVVYVTTAAASRPDGLAVALASGFGTAAMAYATSARINPVLTAAAAACGRCGAAQACADVGAQLTGALLGSAVLRLGAGSGGLGGNALPAGTTPVGALLEEAFAACFVVFAVLRAAPDVAPLVHGTAMVGATAALLPATSCAVNPFRALAPAVVSWAFGRRLWLFVVAPVAGGAAGAALARLLDGRPDGRPDGPPARGGAGDAPLESPDGEPSRDVALDMRDAFSRFQAAARLYGNVGALG